MVNRFAGDTRRRATPASTCCSRPEQIPRLGEWLALAAAAAAAPRQPGRGPSSPSGGLDRSLTTGPWAYLKISDGCSNCCHYCLIPRSAGRTPAAASRPCSTRRAPSSTPGARELNLVGQDITRYGEGRRGGGLPGLVRAIGGAPGGLPGPPALPAPRARRRRDPRALRREVERLLRLPRHPDPARELPRAAADEPALRPARALAHSSTALRARVPGIALRTTVMVGYPGEGRREFAELLAFLARAPLREPRRLRLLAPAGDEGRGAAGRRLPRRGRGALPRGDDAAGGRPPSGSGRSRRGTETEALLLEPAFERTTVWTGRTAWQAPEVDGQIVARGARGSGDLGRACASPAARRTTSRGASCPVADGGVSNPCPRP